MFANRFKKIQNDKLPRKKPGFTSVLHVEIDCNQLRVCTELIQLDRKEPVHINDSIWVSRIKTSLLLILIVIV